MQSGLVFDLEVGEHLVFVSGSTETASFVAEEAGGEEDEDWGLPITVRFVVSPPNQPPRAVGGSGSVGRCFEASGS